MSGTSTVGSMHRLSQDDVTRRNKLVLLFCQIHKCEASGEEYTSSFVFQTRE